MQYQAPANDLRFLLFDVLGADKLHELEKYTDATPDLISAVIDEAGNMFVEQGARTAPKYRYFNGDNFPSADQPWTHVDGSSQRPRTPSRTKSSRWISTKRSA